VFGEGAHWLVVDTQSWAVERLSLPTASIQGEAISDDGQRFAYVAPARKDSSSGLWTWRRGDKVPRLLGSEPGRYSDPAFAPDGSLYFSHSTQDGSRHMFGSYAQLFRLPGDRNEAERVTDENGCHFSASFTGAGVLNYIHSSCAGQTWVKRRHPGSSPKVLVSAMGTLAEATTSPDGEAVLYVAVDPDTYILSTRRRAETASRVITRLRRTMSRVRPQFGRDLREVLYQSDGKIWIWRDGKITAFAPLVLEMGSR